MRGIPSRISAQNNDFCASPVPAMRVVQKTQAELQKLRLPDAVPSINMVQAWCLN
jgi:hypothetical protein